MKISFWKSTKTQPEIENFLLLIQKKNRKLTIYNGAKPVKTYRIALGFEPLGDKLREGDGRTPEGEFMIRAKNPKSRYFLSLCLNYPTIKHAAKGVETGAISNDQFDKIVRADAQLRLPPQKTRLGGEIYIHGGGILWDWTCGCIALENREIKVIFDQTPLGARVVIEP